MRLHVTPSDPNDPWIDDLVAEAAAMVVGADGFEFVTPSSHDPYDVGFDAYLQEHEGFPGEGEPDPWVLPEDREKPFAFIIPSHETDDPVSETIESVSDPITRIIAPIEDRPAAVAEVARWLSRVTDAGVGNREREMLEVVVREVRDALDSGRLDRFSADDRAQTQAALDTVSTQLRAPKPSRRILAAALGQIPSYIVGVVSGMTANYVPELFRLLS